MKYAKSCYLKAVTALAFVAISCSCVAWEAQAQSLITAANPQTILDIARGYGSAELSTDSVNDPLITGRIDGTSYRVYFYGCSNGRNCKTIDFYAAWSSNRVSLRDVNEWNRTKRFTKAYLDSDDDPILEMSVNLDNGVSRGNLDYTFDWWKVTLKQFKEQFNL